MHTTIGRTYVHRGEIGCRVTVRFDHSDRLPGTYHFGTHGMQAADILAKRAAIVVHHTKKAARYLGFEGTVRGKSATAAGKTFTVECATILERGANVELVVIARASDGEAVRLRRVCFDMDSVPGDGAILGMVRSAVAVHMSNKSDGDAHAVAVSAALGATPESEGDRLSVRPAR